MRCTKMLSNHLLISTNRGAVHINSDEVKILFVFILNNYFDEIQKDLNEFIKRLG